MSSLIILPTKDTTDGLAVVFPFLDQMAFGEVITGAVVTIVVTSGDDPNPTVMLEGIPDYTTSGGRQVVQLVIGGLNGVTYQLVCTVVTSLSNAFICQGQLVIIDDPTLSGS